MRARMKKRIANRSGFTLAEVMMAVLILAMVSVIVAAGIPSAIRAYTNVTEVSNAELLLSTTMTRLRDELGTATIEKVNANTITYRSANGSQSVLSLELNNDEPGIYLQEYNDVVGADLSKYKHLLVSFQAANRSLYATYTLEDGAYDKTNGTITFTDLSVTNGSKDLTTIETFTIRILAN